MSPTKTTALLACRCGATNRIALGVRSRCGKCKHLFTPQELTKAKIEAPAYALEQEDDEPIVQCKCGWEGTEDEVDMDDQDRARCPDCGKRVKLPEEDEG